MTVKFDEYTKAEGDLECSLQDGIEVLGRAIVTSEKMLRFHGWKWKQLHDLRVLMIQVRNGMQDLKSVAYPQEMVEETGGKSEPDQD